MNPPRFSLMARPRGYVVACHTCWWHQQATTETAADMLMDRHARTCPGNHDHATAAQARAFRALIAGC